MDIVFDMSNACVLVVGASSGIGRAVAVMAAGSGARVWAVARREELLMKMNSMNSNITPVKADVENIEAFVKTLVSLTKQVKFTHLVYCVAATNDTPPDMMFNVNCVIPVTITKLLVRHGLRSAVYISSLANVVPTGELWYDASKAALSHVVADVARELTPCRVNAVCPARVVDDDDLRTTALTVCTLLNDDMHVTGVNWPLVYRPVAYNCDTDKWM